MARCTHVDSIDLQTPGRVEGVCEDCVQEGTSWVSLRVCKTCGHVGCCDNSPRRHARAHFSDTSHPVMGPADGSWNWCFADDDYVQPDGSLGS